MACIRINSLLFLLFISEALAAVNLQKATADLTQELELASNCTDFVQIASNDGYNVETHEVTTDDGYILTMHRLPPGDKCSKKTPLLAMHGLFQSSEGFITSGEHSPGYVLAGECHDLWFGNVRGNFHSRNHTTLDPDRDLEFWKFSIDEMAYYDIPAMIDYVLDRTGVKKLIYLGYSQGGGTFIAMNSEKPEYTDKISLFIGLAPSTRNYHTRSLPFRTASIATDSLEIPLETAGVWEILSKGMPIQGALSTLCQVELLAATVCELTLSAIDSPHPDSLTPEITKKIVENAPAGTSVQNFARYGQAMQELEFLKFSYGAAQNLEIYGSSEPPQYNISANTMPALVFQGKADHIVDPQDSEWAVAQLPNLVEYVVVSDPLWNHLDMSYSRYWNDTIFSTLKIYLEEYTEFV